jgi:hypothetical protein
MSKFVWTNNDAAISLKHVVRFHSKRKYSDSDDYSVSVDYERGGEIFTERVDENRLLEAIRQEDRIITPAVPGTYLVKYFKEDDFVLKEPVIAWRYNAECELMEPVTATVRFMDHDELTMFPDGIVVGTGSEGVWPSLEAWKEWRGHKKPDLKVVED